VRKVNRIPQDSGKTSPALVQTSRTASSLARSLEPALRSRLSSRWAQLAAIMVCQAMISNVQYSWTLFVTPIDAKFHWGRPSIQVAFSILALTQAFLMPVTGYVADRFKPQLLLSIGGVLAAMAWLVNASATSLFILYLGALLAGLAFAVVSGAACGNMLRWFPDRRGLAMGLTSGAFAVGAAFTAVSMTTMIQRAGYEATFFWFGIAQGAVIIFAAMFLRAPVAQATAVVVPRRVQQSSQDLTPRQALGSPVFCLLYLMFVLVCTGGLIIVAQLGVMAKDFGLASEPVSLLGVTLAALPFALALSRTLDGLGRPFFGMVSDYIGRENTMAMAFLMEATGIAGLLLLGHAPAMFVLCSGMVLFAWGEIFSLFPAMTGDLFGQKFAATNWGLLWSGKGVASLLVPLASWLSASVGTWTPVLTLVLFFDVIAAALAFVVLKPMCVRTLASTLDVNPPSAVGLVPQSIPAGSVSDG
jgi:MFS transporter, OFA family, oxalate/formate antiporter